MIASDLDPNGKEQSVTALSGDPSPKPAEEPQPSVSTIARERFMSVVGRSLTHIGLDEVNAGKVLLAIRWTGKRLERDFVLNPKTKAGLVWGYTNGGAVSIDIPLNTIHMATCISLKTGDALSVKGEGGALKFGERGYWIAAFGYEPNVPEIPKLPERGMTKHFTTVDQSGFI